MLSSEQLLNPSERAVADVKSFSQLNHLQLLLRFRERYLWFIAAQKFRALAAAEVQAETFWGRKMVLPLNDLNARYLYLFRILNGPEYKPIRWVMRNLTKKDVFYDVGANYGFYAAVAIELGAETHAFEPLPQVYKYLSKNLGNHAFSRKIALSDKIGRAAFYDSSLRGSSGRSTTSLPIAQEMSLESLQKIEIDTTTLDQYVMDGNRPPSVMKIDVEGAESLVLKGGAETIGKYHPAIIMEIWMGGGPRQELAEEAVEILKRFGYVSYGIADNGEAHKGMPWLLPYDNVVFKYRTG